MISLKMTKNVGDLDKLIVAKGFKKLPKVQKMPNLVTLLERLLNILFLFLLSSSCGPLRRPDNRARCLSAGSRPTPANDSDEIGTDYNH